MKPSLKLNRMLAVALRSGTHKALLCAVLAAGLLATVGLAQTYSTTFDGDENPLSEGGKWTNNGLDWTKIRKKGGIAFGTETGTNTGKRKFDDSYAHLSGFPPDQEAWGEVYIAKPDSSCNQEVEILLRWTSEEHSTTGYECFAKCVDDATSYLQIVRWEGPLGKFTYLVDNRGAGYGLNNGDILKASVVGNVITVYVNGVEKAQAKDDTHKTGNPGIGTFLSCNKGRGVGSNGDFGFTSFTARAIGAKGVTNRMQRLPAGEEISNTLRRCMSLPVAGRAFMGQGPKTPLGSSLFGVRVGGSGASGKDGRGGSQGCF